MLQRRFHKYCRTRTVFRDPQTKRNWQNWMAHVENTHYLDMTNHLKRTDGSVETGRSVQYWTQQSVTTKAVAELRSESNSHWRRISFMDSDREWIEQIRDGNVGRISKKTATMKLETVQGDLRRKQDRNKHQCRCHLP